ALQLELRAAVGLPPLEHPADEPDRLVGLLHERYAGDLREAKKRVIKHERNEAVDALQERVLAELCPEGATGDDVPTPAKVKSAYYALQERVVRETILDGYRPDGRGPKDLRRISCEVGVLPSAHGSAVFQRGE